MIQKIRPFRSSLLAALWCGASTVSLLAQGPGGPPYGGPGRHHGPPPNALFDALDTNHDGVISADEINNAAASLKSLLKNGSAEIKREDLRPARQGPPRGGGTAADSARPQERTQDQPANGAGTAADAPAGGPGGHPHHGPPPSPLFDALDTNHDGVISADEMSNAPASLKAMLKNGSTDIKREDVRPHHPPQGPGN